MIASVLQASPRDVKKIFDLIEKGSALSARDSITGSTVYWGSGYANIRPGTLNNKVFAFSLNGEN